MQDVPSTRFVGVNLGSARDVLADHWDCITFPADNPWDRSPKGALAGDNHDLALAILATLLATIGKTVRGASAGAEIGTIDLDLAGEFVAADYNRAHSLAELVQQHEA